MMKTHTRLLSVIEQVLCIVAKCASVSDTAVIISACDETRQHVAPSVFGSSSKVNHDRWADVRTKIPGHIPLTQSNFIFWPQVIDIIELFVQKIDELNTSVA